MTALWVAGAALAIVAFALFMVVVLGAVLRGHVAFDDDERDDEAQREWEAFKDAMAKWKAGK